MKQLYNNYSEQDHLVWNVLFERQLKNLEDKACSEYLDCLGQMQNCFKPNRIPDFKEVNKTLLNSTGWSIEVVKGLIPVEEFFELLAQKKFCSSTWLRQMHQLDYLEEPDMFHDTFGHIPLLMNPVFAAFMQSFGQAGVLHKNNPQIVLALQRLYWYTIEFGLMRTEAGNKIYGAGIISSFGESKHVFKKEIDIRPFDLHEIINLPFRTDVIQTTYFAISSFEQLFAEMKKFTEVAGTKKMHLF